MRFAPSRRDSRTEFLAANRNCATEVNFSVSNLVSEATEELEVREEQRPIMAKPILLSVDDDSDVLRAIERDLRSQYGAEYRVIGSDSPEGALDLLKQLKVRNDSVALLLVDQRMPRMDGVEFLQEAMAIFPGAKRALLTAYADTTAAISAINRASINYFFLKPWDPPAEHLYPQLDDLLDDWRASFRPTFQGIRVLGTRWSRSVVRAAGLPGSQPRPVSVDRCRAFRE